MTKNVAAVLYGERDLRIQEVPMPAPGPREVLVAIRSVGVCGSDVHYYEHGRIGDFVVKAPLILGHECSGVVVGAGGARGEQLIGSRVAVEPGVPCGRCSTCRAGRYNLCRDVRFLATPPVDGALARFITVDEDYIYPIPDSLSDDAGALIEPLSVGVWANRSADTKVGSRVLVIGAGPIGVLAAQVARASGAQWIGIADIDPMRRAAVPAVADVDVVLETAAGAEVFEPDIVIECTGAPAAVHSGVAALVSGGVMVLVGMGPDADTPLPLGRVQARELRIRGIFRYANAYRDAIGLAVSGRVRLDEMVGASVPLDEAESALTSARRNPSVLKAVVRVS